MRSIQLAVGRFPNVKTFRNNVALAFVGQIVNEDRVRRIITLRDYRRIDCGLFKGSGDLIGWRTATLDEFAALGYEKVAQFLSPEVKWGTGRLRPEQATWMSAVNDAGGLALTVRSPDDLINGLRARRD